MDIKLSKKPKKPTIILGFPGVGLVGPIVTEFLIEHMKTETIGEFHYDELPATAAIHKGKLVHPMSVHYSKQYNTIIVYTILNLHGHEWEVAKIIRKIAEEVDAKEIICIDGANTLGESKDELYAFGSPKLLKLGAKPLDESVITGVTGAILLTEKNTTCLFASVENEMPNSKGAADVVKVLDKYLNMNVDPQPLLKQAKVFEDKLKSVMDQSKQVLSEQDKKKMDYFG